LNIKFKFYALTFVLHAVLLVSAYFFVEENKTIFIAVECVLLTSLALFLLLIKKILAPLEFVDLFNDILSEQEFTTRFSYTGNKELDNLMTYLTKC